VEAEEAATDTAREEEAATVARAAGVITAVGVGAAVRGVCGSLASRILRLISAYPSRASFLRTAARITTAD